MLHKTLNPRLRTPLYAALYTTLLALPLTATADIIGAEFGAYAWQPDFSGNVSTGGAAARIDLQDDLGFDDDDSTSYYIALEHPLPLLPNLLLSYTDLETSASATLNRDIAFDDQVYTFNSNVNSTLDLSHTDATFYYELLDNWVNLDMGVTARIFDSQVDISDNNNTGSESLDVVVPMLYAAGRFDLPLTGLYAGASANGVSLGDADLLDYLINIGYETSLGLGMELGYRKMDLDYDDDNDEIDLTADGAYVGVYFDF
jgi:outer membrane protein